MILCSQSELSERRDRVRTSDGKIVWHENIGRMGGAPATVELDGKQYLLVSGGNSLFAYALP